MVPGAVLALLLFLPPPAVSLPPPKAPASTWLRRVTLDLTARLPAADSLARIERSDTPATRAALVDELIASPAFARRWGKLLAAPLISAERDLATLARRTEDYLVDALAKRRAWSEIVAELVTAEGSVDEKPAAAFLLQYIEARSEVAWRLATGILGARIGCAQCHDHPFSRWTVADFHGLAAWFARTRRISLPRELYHVYREGRAGRYSQVEVVLSKESRGKLSSGQIERIARDLAVLNRHPIGGPPRTGGRPVTIDVMAAQPMTVAGGSMSMASRVGDLSKTVPILVEEGSSELPVPQLPELPGALKVTLAGATRGVTPRTVPPKLPPGGPALGAPGAGASRRAHLARWLTDPANPYLAPALVNRVVMHLFGRALVLPVDGVDSPDDPRHAARLAGLASQFAADGTDVVRLIRRLALSPEYAVVAAGDSGEALRPLVRALDAEQVAGALASGLALTDPSLLERALARTRTERAGDVPRAGEDLGTLDLPRALFLLSGPELASALSRSPRLSGLARQPPARRLDALFTALLAREPTAGERARLAGATPADLVWAIVASAEFLTNH